MVSGQSFTQNLNQKGIKDLDLRLRASVRSKRHTPGPSQEGSVARGFVEDGIDEHSEFWEEKKHTPGP